MAKACLLRTHPPPPVVMFFASLCAQLVPDAFSPHEVNTPHLSRAAVPSGTTRGDSQAPPDAAAATHMYTLVAVRQDSGAGLGQVCNALRPRLRLPGQPKCCGQAEHLVKLNISPMSCHIADQCDSLERYPTHLTQRRLQ